MKNNHLVISITILIVLILSCANPDKGKDGNNPGLDAGNIEDSAPSTTVDPAALNYVHWELIELATKPVADYPDQNKKPYITFNQATGMVHGTGGCNSVTAQYTLGVPSLMSFKNLVRSKMACPDLTVEAAFLGALKKTTNYTIAGSILALRDSAGNEVAKFMATE